MSKATIRPYINAAARAWRTEPLRDSPIEFHRSLPGYEPTPLRPVPAIAEALGVANVLVKDESLRLGLPAFKILGASYAVSRALSQRLGETEALSLATLRERLRAEDELTLLAATDGNHGRAVAHVAALLEMPASIYVPPGVSDAAKAAIVAEGAQLIEVDLSYDDVVANAASQQSERAVLIQDTSWAGYEDVPQWIVDGYATMLEEVDAQLAALDIEGVDLVVVPAGVGSFAQAVVHHYRSTQHAPALLIVEPEAAAAVAIALHSGRVVPVMTNETVMTGLNCGTVSEIAWPTLRDGVGMAVTVTDDQALSAVAELNLHGVDSGPCGAATLAALRSVVADLALRDALGLGPESVVVLLSTEGIAANPKVNAL